jgi:ABC-2 type transport system ATP-binding protein
MKSFIELKNITLEYELYIDKTDNLKETIINFFRKIKHIEQKKRFIKALDNINLKIEEGDRLGIIGRNGAGKSTLLKVIAGILKPTSGDLFIQGKVQPLIEIGAGFNPEFTGRENIYLNAYMLGFGKKEAKEKEQEIIAFADIGEFIDVPIKYYSSGMTVRLAFSIATIINPEILLVDEMLAAGDAAFIEKATRRINELINKAKIMVVVSHDLNFVKKICNKWIWIDHGKIKSLSNIPSVVDEYLAFCSSNERL